MELTYTTRGDYLLPDLNVPESPKIGKYGMLRRSYLREHRDGIYTGMLMLGKLNGHLEEIDRTANEMMYRLTTELAKAQGVTESLKASNQMQWIGLMNNIRNQAEEIVMTELVYS